MPGTQQSLNLLCLMCNEVLDEDRTDVPFCEDCFNDNTWSCDSCCETFNQPDAPMVFRNDSNLTTFWPYSTIDTNAVLCDDCVNFCPNCNEAYEYESSCDECCPNECDLHSYDFMPAMKFYRMVGDVAVNNWHAVHGELYMGIELEVEKMVEHVDLFLSDANEDHHNPEFVYAKSDGSLSSSGVELVTMPATLEAFKKMWPADAMDAARNRGARAFYYPSCGFHIHVSRSAFTPTHMWKFVRFQLKNPELCQRIGQRVSSSYAEWWGLEDELRSLPDTVKGKRTNHSRYVAINFQRRATVELRYFKGNILNEAIYRNVEFVDSMYEYTKHLTIRDIRDGAFMKSRWMLWVKQNKERYPNLYSFLTGSGMTNENPIEMEAN